MSRYHPVTFLDGFCPRPGGENFETCFISWNSGGLGRAEGRCEGGKGSVGALDLIDVGRVEGGGEGTKGQKG